MNHEDRSQRRRWGALTVLSAAAGAAVAAATIPAAPAFASPGDDAAAAAVSDLVKAPTDLAKMDTAITTYFEDLSPEQRLYDVIGTAGGGSDAGEQAVSQENATILDIFGSTSSQGAMSFENMITGYYDSLIGLLGGGGGITADAAAIMKQPELVLMNDAITTYFDDLSPEKRMVDFIGIGTGGGGSDAGAQAVAQEDATIVDIFGNTTSPGAVGFETGIQDYYVMLNDLLGGGGIYADAAAAVKVNEDAVMEKTIETYFNDLSGPERLLTADLMGFPTGSPDPGDLAVAQENATILDIFGSLTSPGAMGFETMIVNYYDVLIDALSGGAATF
jgi:hypothetical protein